MLFSTLFLFLVVALFLVDPHFCYKSLSPVKTPAISSYLRFKSPNHNPGVDDNSRDTASESDNGTVGGLWGSLKRFLPLLTQAKLDKSFAKEVTDPGNRYHVRLTKPDQEHKRHVTIHIKRVFPDISWQRAEQIYAQALANGRALIQIVPSKRLAKDAVDSLRRANPSVFTEVYDSKEDKVVYVGTQYTTF